MFGGLAVPANSPHLRKSGSRAVVSDLDEHEVENGAEEGFLYSGEVNDSKGGVAPISASGIMPSPIFLWRFKIIPFISCIGDVVLNKFELV
ncbi:hypothetical protein Ahy_A08g039647 isoform D [Arachis hypogaea]|uniref:Uncharacterized protein n=1 Tax=Arachis hypogaea TaxID=3818 RepID=A0A445BWV9_ARAHY|nr:hypothetical protein Ahy_A08g039647 isoform D [Arachis hypogaea]